VVLAVDGDPVGWVAGAAPEGVPVPVRVVADDVAEAAARLVAPVLPEPLARWRPEQAAVEARAEVAPTVAPTLPPWLAGMLPKTAMTLGLDLQGGIDLTLQVDMDAAVVAAVQRDRKVLADRAADAGKTIQVQRDRSRYALEISSDEAFDALRAWTDDQLRGEYVYVESVDREGRTWNVWEMAAQRVADLEDQAVEQNLETLRKRIDATGVKEPSIVKMGGGRINIQLPGVTDTRAATDAIATQATLEFRLVDENADPNAVQRAVSDAERALPPEQFADAELLNDWLRAEGRLPEGRIVLWEYEETSPGKLERVAPLQLKEEVILTGADVENAGVGFDQNNIPRVLMDFKARGAQIFCDVTKANVGKRFAILLDGEIRSAPSIREAICGGSASIEMGSSANAIDDANTLALVLRSGALTAPVDIGEVRQIGASLGADAIRSGTRAALLGSVLVALFMFVWYRLPGLVADVAVALNVLFAFALLALFGATLTLPGIAGIALTVGMAVDANIIVYERIREELKLGVTARQAVDAGYDKALSAILDANITTAIAGIVLYSFGTGPIKGFAVTLLVGIVTTLATALYVTRALMDLLTRSATARLRL
jgi:protein-export membrane protein SecD